ncbi:MULTISPECIES: Tellurite resistance protein TerB [unclassified Bradyrhizobium]|uniref:Tellurite resistance protein TerB n=1 Tax=unclassified Bradyrhizobium TaxID=2631580 RepID=UPI0028ECD943|nr:MULTISPECIES: Tellurite resistance protein TerB [unclassified Bradyrhizobium]
MGFLSNLLKQADKAINSYTGDKAFLAGVAAAAANVTAADGSIDDAEINAAISGMLANPIVSASYSASQIEEALNAALARAKSRAGRMENKRAIEALMTRDISARQDVFLIAADVADQDGIGDQERVVLADIGKALNVDDNKLLAA